MPVSVSAAVATVLAVLLGGASAASAAQTSQGSVPVEVAAFAVAPDGLVASLDDFFGPGADGKGIDFDDTTEIGAVDRVFTFTAAWLAGEATTTPVGMANEWAVPVSVAGEPVGVAIIWINPGTVLPQLAEFIPSSPFAEGLAEVADDAWVVSDEPREAWFVLAPPTLTPLAAGTSGVAGDTSLSAYQISITKAGESHGADVPLNLGSALSVGTIVAASLVVILVLLVPLVWHRRRIRSAQGQTDDA